jgi:hypothetical protein
VATHHPVIEPVSEIRVRNGIFRYRDRRSNPPFCLAETEAETGGELEKARYPRDECTDHPRSSILEDWVVEALGHKLETHHPVIEPVSAAEPGTEICDAETGTQKAAYHPAEINPETRRSAKSPHSGAINAKRLTEV